MSVTSLKGQRKTWWTTCSQSVNDSKYSGKEILLLFVISFIASGVSIALSLPFPFKFKTDSVRLGKAILEPLLFMEDEGITPVVAMSINHRISTTGMPHSCAFSNLIPLLNGHSRCVERRENVLGIVNPSIDLGTRPTVMKLLETYRVPWRVS